MSPPPSKLHIQPKPQTPRKPRPLRLTPERVVIPEKKREKNGIQVLTLLGYLVKTTGKPVSVTCEKCGTFQWARRTGNSTGVGDLLVTHPTYWPGGVWQMLDTKRTGGAKREEQVKLADAGLLTFYVTEAEAIRAVIACEERMGLSPNPRLLRYLQVNTPGQWVKEADLAPLTTGELPLG